MNRNTSYKETNPNSANLLSIVGDLPADFKTLIKKEIELAKVEMGGKFSMIGRNAAFAGAGGVLGLVAVVLLFIGLGALIAKLLQDRDLSPGMAHFLSFTGLALLLGVTAYGLIHKAIAAFKKISLAPKQALASVQAAEAVPDEITSKIKEEQTPPKQSTEELKSEVISTRTQMDAKIGELMARLTPGYAAKSILSNLSRHPMRALLVSATTTGIGGYLYYRKHKMLAKGNGSKLRHWWDVRSPHM